MASLTEWRIAYAKQGRSDLQAREQLLQDSDLPACHQLHFLQMACEKICKAHLCGQNTNPAVLRKSHGYISGVMPVIARQYLRQARSNQAWIPGAISRLARQVELLAPTEKDGGTRPDNCEYPWERANGDIVVPVEHNFQLDLNSRSGGGLHLLKILLSAAEDLAREGD